MVPLISLAWDFSWKKPFPMCACRNVNLGLLHKAFGVDARYLAAWSGIPIAVPLPSAAWPSWAVTGKASVPSFQSSPLPLQKEAPGLLP